METMYFLFGIGTAVATAISGITIYNVIELRKLLKRYEIETRILDDRFNDLYDHIENRFENTNQHCHLMESAIYEKFDELQRDRDNERRDSRDLLTD